jgi:hypothetical protein
MPHSNRLPYRLVLWSAGYAAMLAAIGWSMVQARTWALDNLATTQSIEDWREWRDDAATMPGRRVPTVAEPPGLVLMRDHFAVCVIGAIVFSSLLYWVIAWFMTGMLRGGAAGGEPAINERTASDQARREGDRPGS